MILQLAATICFVGTSGISEVCITETFKPRQFDDEKQCQVLGESWLNIGATALVRRRVEITGGDVKCTAIDQEVDG